MEQQVCSVHICESAFAEQIMTRTHTHTCSGPGTDTKPAVCFVILQSENRTRCDCWGSKSWSSTCPTLRSELFVCLFSRKPIKVTCCTAFFEITPWNIASLPLVVAKEKKTTFLQLINKIKNIFRSQSGGKFLAMAIYFIPGNVVNVVKVSCFLICPWIFPLPNIQYIIHCIISDVWIIWIDANYCLPLSLVHLISERQTQLFFYWERDICVVHLHNCQRSSTQFTWGNPVLTWNCPRMF